jgi:hypothetical protein
MSNPGKQQALEARTAGIAKPQSSVSLAEQSMITKDPHRISCGIFMIMG